MRVVVQAGRNAGERREEGLRKTWCVCGSAVVVKARWQMVGIAVVYGGGWCRRVNWLQAVINGSAAYGRRSVNRAKAVVAWHTVNGKRGTAQVTRRAREMVARR